MKTTVEGPAGRLEAILEAPEGTPPTAAAVVCHPHPQYGGTMRNTIVFRVARALREAGLATLRFNFRGVEGSEGAYDGEGAEEGDARAGLDRLAAEFPGVPLWAAGTPSGRERSAGWRSPMSGSSGSS